MGFPGKRPEDRTVYQNFIIHGDTFKDGYSTTLGRIFSETRPISNLNNNNDNNDNIHKNKIHHRNNNDNNNSNDSNNSQGKGSDTKKMGGGAMVARHGSWMQQKLRNIFNRSNNDSLPPPVRTLIGTYEMRPSAAPMLVSEELRAWQ